MLALLFWILLILIAIGWFAPPWRPYSVVAVLILLALLGLRVFPVSLH